MKMFAFAVAALLAPALPVQAQEAEAPMRYRVALGPQLVPNFPGAKDHDIRPLIDVSRARGDAVFRFEAIDESFDIQLVHSGPFSFGPAINLEGKRRRRDVDVEIDEVGFTVEAGGFAQLWLSDALRARVEVRKGINGHKGLIANAGVDLVARQGDDWLFSIGPRVTLSDDTYQRAYFGVSPRVATATGLPAYDAGSGVHAVGATAGGTYQFTRRWGIYGYAKYDRLVADAARSPFIREYGSRDQLSGGAALTFTFGKGFR